MKKILVIFLVFLGSTISYASDKESLVGVEAVSGYTLEALERQCDGYAFIAAFAVSKIMHAIADNKIPNNDVLFDKIHDYKNSFRTTLEIRNPESGPPFFGLCQIFAKEIQ